MLVLIHLLGLSLGSMLSCQRRGLLFIPTWLWGSSFLCACHHRVWLHKWVIWLPMNECRHRLEKLLIPTVDAPTCLSIHQALSNFIWNEYIFQIKKCCRKLACGSNPRHHIYFQECFLFYFLRFTKMQS